MTDCKHDKINLKNIFATIDMTASDDISHYFLIAFICMKCEKTFLIDEMIEMGYKLVKMEEQVYLKPITYP